MKIFPYDQYTDYVAAQSEANKAKIDVVWVTSTSVDRVCAHRGAGVKSILCHGTRNGAEQSLFAARYPQAKIVGSEISETASWFPMTVRWDMQRPNREWTGRFDLVYSNAFDHAIYPYTTIVTWLDQLAEGGVLYVDHADDPRCNRSDKVDPLQIEPAELVALIESAGGRILGQFVGEGPRKFQTRIYAVQRC